MASVPKGRLFRVFVLAIVGFLGFSSVHSTPSVSPSPSDDATVYVMPLLWGYLTMSDAEFAQEVGELHNRIGTDGSGVRVGFTSYVNIEMTDPSVNPDDPAAVRAALAGTIARIDSAIARARTHNIPVALSFLTALRSGTDALQSAAETRDRRSMQWYSDNGLASGWLTYSRYARRERRLFAAYVQELGRVLANRMAVYPETLVAASGDGEIEMSTDRATEPATAVLADFSPFAVAEFRDWLTARGMYGTGQHFAAEAYANAARYAGDLSPSTDDSGDGHTLKSDFGTNFDTWALKYFDWDFTDAPESDPRALPASVYGAPGWNPMAVSNENGFDAPRERAPKTPWLDVWHEFRSTVILRYNRDFARWMTTTPDPATGKTVPPARWYSYQIPSDYIFNGTPANPNPRLESSASPWWTADVSPYGGIGITSFNINLDGSNYFRTLAGIAPVIGARGVRWGLIEWHPSVQASETANEPDNLAIYREDIARIEQYKASLLVPFYWNSPFYKVKNSGFETALREFVDRTKNKVRWDVDRQALYFGGVSSANVVTAMTGPQELVIRQVGNQLKTWQVTSSQPWIRTSVAGGTGSARITVRVDSATAPANGVFAETLTIAGTDGSGVPTTVAVNLKVSANVQGAPPVGTFDTPVDGTMNLTGSVALTGWAIDDIEVTKVEIWRDAHPGDPAGAIAGPGLFAQKLFIGFGTFSDGSRPDIEGLAPTTPRASRAGWGYLMLTRGLIWDGAGPFRLYAYAYDAEGHIALLGAKLVSIANATATQPFGAIDTPGQGETVSGMVNNFGWVLALPGRTIPQQNVQVYIDGGLVGVPGGLTNRSDIDAGFASQGFDTSQALRVITFDSRNYADGLHTIGWLVYDSTGAGDGVGSRFFRILNATAPSAGAVGGLAFPRGGLSRGDTSDPLFVRPQRPGDAARPH